MSTAEPIYKKLTDLGVQLQATSDAGARERIHDNLRQIQERWISILSSLEGRRGQLEGMMELWAETELSIEDVLRWLREMRLALAHELPDNYDQLQWELQQCKVGWFPLVIL